MIRKTTKWFMQLSKVGKTLVVGVLLVGVGAANSSAYSSQQPRPSSSPSPTTAPYRTDLKGAAAKKAVITHKTETTTETVPFTTSTVNSATLNQGTTRVQTEGVDGLRTHTFEVTMSDGVEIGRTEVKNEVTLQAVPKVIQVGTYVAPSCPNGTYINTYGNTVCRPYESPSAPAGATARCVDGTYSYSQTRSGTCSHHGGVANWL